ncbi:MAG: cytochrome c biogenesis protein CcsA [Trueperaceae bacterium]
MSGQALLVLAAVASGGVLLLALLPAAPTLVGAARGGAPLLRSAQFLLTGLAAIFATGAALDLALRLAAGGFGTRYVWQHTASYQPLGQRVSALLAGQEGTLLVWSLVVAVFALVAASLAGRASRADAAVAHAAYLTMTALTLALLATTLRSDPFLSFADAFPTVAAGTVPIEGRGLNPVLQNPWMPLHTALTFLGYGALALGFALALGQLLAAGRGDGRAIERGRATLMRAAAGSWLVLTLAILSGLLWAYEEMTFGWYWSWDPVEAATLAIWLVLTAALHAPAPATHAGPARWLATPFLVAGAWVLVVFAAFVTRSGLHPSVHAFAGGATAPFLGTLLALLVAALAAATLAARAGLRRASPSHDAARRPDPGRPPPSAPWAATALLSGLGALVVWGLAFPILASRIAGRPIELETAYFNLWGSLFAIAILSTLGLTMPGARLRGDRRALTVALLATLLAAALAPSERWRLLDPDQRVGLAPLYQAWGQLSALALLPPGLYALAATLDRWTRRWRDGGALERLRETGLALVHAGFVLTAVALALSTLLTTSVTLPVVPGASEPTRAGALAVHATELRRTDLSDARGAVVEQREALAVTVTVDGARVASGTAELTTYPDRGQARHARVLIDRGIWTDTQVIYHGVAESGPAGLPVTVRRIPLAAAVWWGLLLLAGGAGLGLAARLARAARPPAEAAA